MNGEQMLAQWFSDELRIGNRDAAWWLVVAIAMGIAAFVTVFRGYRARQRFATKDRLDFFFERSSFLALHPIAASAGSALMVSASLGLLTIALMDVRWGKTQQEVPQKGIEILFLLDVSRSMLAEDVAPNRLARAKQMIRDMVARMAGDRVGLTVFAGESRQTIPLTNHYEDFNQMLEEADSDALRRGGSRLGDAIDSARLAFLDKTNAQQVIVVLTDGEDQESEPVKIARRLYEEKQTRIFTVGLGDMDSGARIPDVDRERPNRETDRYVEFRGQPVWSKMNGQILREIAGATDGVYIPAGTRQVDMAAIYDRYIASMESTQFASATVDAYTPRFQWFALPALVILLIEFAGRLSWKKTLLHSNRRAPGSTPWLLVACSVIACPTLASAQPSANPSGATTTEIAAHNRGVELYRQGDFDAAADEFAQAATALDNAIASSARYNLGTTLYASALAKLGADRKAASESMEQVKQSLAQAVDAFRSSLRIEPQRGDARANLEKTIRLLQELKQQEQQQSEQDNRGETPQDDSEQQQDSSPQDSSPDDSSSGDSSSGDSSSDPTEEKEESDPAAGKEESEPSTQGTNEEQSESPPSTEPEDQGELPDENADQPDDVGGKLSSENNREPNGDDQQSATASQLDPLPIGESMTAEEAMKMLQAVRDRDMIRRFRLQQMRQRRQIPVEQDW